MRANGESRPDGAGSSIFDKEGGIRRRQRLCRDKCGSATGGSTVRFDFGLVRGNPP